MAPTKFQINGNSQSSKWLGFEQLCPKPPQFSPIDSVKKFTYLHVWCWCPIEIRATREQLCPQWCCTLTKSFRRRQVANLNKQKTAPLTLLNYLTKAKIEMTKHGQNLFREPNAAEQRVFLNNATTMIFRGKSETIKWKMNSFTFNMNSFFQVCDGFRSLHYKLAVFPG